MSGAPPRRSLEARFKHLWQRLGAAGDGGAVFTALDAAYREPGRVYHTIEHLAEFTVDVDSGDAKVRVFCE